MKQKPRYTFTNIKIKTKGFEVKHEQLNEYLQKSNY